MNKWRTYNYDEDVWAVPLGPKGTFTASFRLTESGERAGNTFLAIGAMNGG